MNAQEITNTVKDLQPGDYIYVARKVNGRVIQFHQVIESVQRTDVGYQLIYIAGITPGIGGPVYRDALSVSPDRGNRELNIWNIKVVSRGSKIPKHTEDYLAPSHYYSRRYPTLKGHPGYDLMM